jgi:SAM-dependent methyltransferase
MQHRWFTENDDDHSQWYADHFRELTAEGADIFGEARLLDAIVRPNSRVLDAGCGQGRTAGALAERGHDVVAVDIDETLLAAAGVDHPGPRYVCSDLAALDLRQEDGTIERFDAAISAGNVITYVAPGTEVAVLSAIRRHLKPDAPFVVGFHTERYEVSAFDRDARAAGFHLESRFATWDLRPWHEDAEFAVTILRNEPEVPRD